MKIKFRFDDVKAFSLNNMKLINWKTKRQIKTSKYQCFKSLIEDLIVLNIRDIKNFNDAYDSKEHYISAEYRFYHKCITKKKEISKTSGDWDNFPKPVQDVVFEYLIADDSAIRSSNVILIDSEIPRIEIEYTLKSLCLLI